VGKICRFSFNFGMLALIFHFPSCLHRPPEASIGSLQDEMVPRLAGGSSIGHRTHRAHRDNVDLISPISPMPGLVGWRILWWAGRWLQ
jgi:hypothetical protein